LQLVQRHRLLEVGAERLVQPSGGSLVVGLDEVAKDLVVGSKAGRGREDEKSGQKHGAGHRQAPSGRGTVRRWANRVQLTRAEKGPQQPRPGAGPGMQGDLFCQRTIKASEPVECREGWTGSRSSFPRPPRARLPRDNCPARRPETPTPAPWVPTPP